jgi:hypothetical protein
MRGKMKQKEGLPQLSGHATTMCTIAAFGRTTVWVAKRAMCTIVGSGLSLL